MSRPLSAEALRSPVPVVRPAGTESDVVLRAEVTPEDAVEDAAKDAVEDAAEGAVWIFPRCATCTD